MCETNKLKLLVNDFTDVQVKGALPLPKIENSVNRIVEVGTETLQNNLQRTLGNVLEILGNTPLESTKLCVKEVKFSLNISSTGEVSLATLARGSISGQTTLEFTIVNKD